MSVRPLYLLSGSRPFHSPSGHQRSAVHFCFLLNRRPGDGLFNVNSAKIQFVRGPGDISNYRTSTSNGICELDELSPGYELLKPRGCFPGAVGDEEGKFCSSVQRLSCN